MKYKKTEWQSIDHENYHVLSDKYRSDESVDIDQLANKNRIIQYAIACTNLYGFIGYSKFLEIYNAQHEPSVSSSELRALLTDAHYTKLLGKEIAFTNRRALIHETIKNLGNYSPYLEGTKGKPFYIPAREELLRYVDDLYYEKTSHQENACERLFRRQYTPD